jgi:hypothetical protein
MSDTPRLGLPELTEAQAGKTTTINEALRILDAMVQPVVLAVDLNEAPSGPSDGDLYIVADSVPSGDDWDNREGCIAYYSSSAWTFFSPEQGWTVYCQDDDMAYRYQGSDGWVPIQDEHELTIWNEGVPANSAVIFRKCATRSIVFPPNFAGSYGNAGTAATASATFVVEIDTVPVGTIVWGVSETVPTFTTEGGSSVTFSAGEMLTVTGPADNDATLAKIAVTLVGLG